MKVDEYAIPVISPDVEIVPFDKTTYLVLQHLYKHQLRISSQLYRVLELVDGRRNLHEIASELNKETHLIEPNGLLELLYTGRLTQCGVIQTSNPVAPRVSTSYLKLRLTLIKSRHIMPLARLCSFLFTPRFFYISGGLMLIGLGWAFLHFVNFRSFSVLIGSNSVNSFSIAFLYGMFYLSTLLHELGHASACRRFGATPGDIGFGFYLVMPVFYADVSDAWRVPAPQRVIIDLAGLYMEILLCTVLCGVFLLYGNIALLYMCLILLLRTYGNLNPFLRMDGYWALADALGRPNLRQDSIRKLLSCWHWLRKREASPFQKLSDYLLFLYALCSQLMIVALLTTVLFFNTKSVLLLPSLVWSIGVKIIRSYPDINLTWLYTAILELIPPILFYVLLINFLAKPARELSKLLQSFLVGKSKATPIPS
ncbi:hypothetical protein [Hymenobacter saemangeumensis]|uniref:hypothetical protein n=1 Tax=Hymenobacter saemangeumensis TaxID=1084522 RepID=UPI0031E7DEE6